MSDDKLDEMVNEPITVTLGSTEIALSKITPEDTAKFRKWAKERMLKEIRANRQYYTPDIYRAMVQATVSGSNTEDVLSGALMDTEGQARYIHIVARKHQEISLNDIRKALENATEEEGVTALSAMGLQRQEEEQDPNE